MKGLMKAALILLCSLAFSAHAHGLFVEGGILYIKELPATAAAETTFLPLGVVAKSTAEATIPVEGAAPFLLLGYESKNGWVVSYESIGELTSKYKSIQTLRLSKRWYLQ